MVYPTRIALVVPSDSPISQAGIDQMCAQMTVNVGRINDWFEEQIGYRFVPDIQCWRSLLTHYELASAPPDPHVDQNWCDEDHWVGMHETSVYREVRRRVYGEDWRIHTEGAAGTRISRIGVVVEEGGGFAGGRSVLDIVRLVDAGSWYLGNWEIHSETFGGPEHCCEIWKGRAFCTRSNSNPGLSFGHEWLHGWFAGNIHSPVAIWLGTDWLPEHRQNVLDHNMAFLEPVGGGGTTPPVEPPPPPPPDDPIPPEPPEETILVGTEFKPNSRTLKRGHGRQYRLRGIYSDGTIAQNISSFADWHSSDPTIATVENGNVVAHQIGEVEIHAHVLGHDAHFALKVRR